MTNYDALETRDAAARAAGQLGLLNRVIEKVAAAPGARRIAGAALADLADLAGLPVLRKSDLAAWQRETPPFGGIPASNISHYFQSPGPIYEPGGRAPDFWRLGRFAHAGGVGQGDIVQNCFAYHLTPAGMMFESAAAAVGAAVIPAGTGQTELQAQAAAHIGATAYAGTPDYLKVILEKADALGLRLKMTKALVSGGALFASLRQYYAARGIACIQAYATADVGLIAYESPGHEGLIVDEGVIVEIVRPGTGDVVPDGEVGEVVVTSLNPDYPLIRFATGDLSAVMAGRSPCGRSNMRIKGWMGRADQTAKAKGMFIRPEQVAELAARFPALGRMRVVIAREGEADVLSLLVETGGNLPESLAQSAQDVLKLRPKLVAVAPESLENNGLVIEDRRKYD